MKAVQRLVIGRFDAITKNLRNVIPCVCILARFNSRHEHQADIHRFNILSLMRFILDQSRMPYRFFLEFNELLSHGRKWGELKMVDNVCDAVRLDIQVGLDT